MPLPVPVVIVPLLLMPPANDDKLNVPASPSPPTKIPCCWTAIVPPLLLIPPEKSDISTELSLKPVGTPPPTRMPSTLPFVAEIMPLLLMPPEKVDMMTWLAPEPEASPPTRIAAKPEAAAMTEMVPLLLMPPEKMVTMLDERASKLSPPTIMPC
jgi:hypothetical protein